MQKRATSTAADEQKPDRANDRASERRRSRARTERMQVSLRTTGGVYDARAESGNTYRVDVGHETCSCPDWQNNRWVDECKHLHRVRLEIERGAVPTPDGRLPNRNRRGVQTESDPTDSPGSRSHATPVKRSEAADAPQATGITGPHCEYDRYGQPTGTTYYRCASCGLEAIRRSDLDDHDCEDRRGTPQTEAEDSEVAS